MHSIHEHPELSSPVLVSALAGWVDAATVGTGAAKRLAGEGRIVATFDPDRLYDYRSQRPILDIVDGIYKKTIWPEVNIRHQEVGGRDVLVLTGHEPDLSWQGFSNSVADIAQELGVTQLITFGAVPAAVPHTIPPPLLATASDPALVDEDERGPDGLLRVPAAAVSIVDQCVQERGIATVGFFVQVPHYVTGTYPSGMLTLLHRLARYLDIEIPLASLEDEAREHQSTLDEIVANQPDAAEHIRALEEMNSERRIMSGEQIAGEIERYLRDTSRGDRGSFEEGGDQAE